VAIFVGVMDTCGCLCWVDGYVWFLFWGDGYVWLCVLG